MLIASLFFLLVIPVESCAAISVPVVLRDLTGAPGIGLRPPPLLLDESCWVLEAAFSVELRWEKAPFIDP